MVKSTVQVMYLELKDQEAFPLLALHYDFELPVKAAHPVFHAGANGPEHIRQSRAGASRI